MATCSLIAFSCGHLGIALNRWTDEMIREFDCHCYLCDTDRRVYMSNEWADFLRAWKANTVRIEWRDGRMCILGPW